MRILNQIVTVTDQGLEYEADQGHAEILMKDICIDESSTGAVTPGVANTSEGRQGCEGGRSSAFWRRKYIQSSGGER